MNHISAAVNHLKIADARRRLAAGMSPAEIHQLTRLQVILYAMHHALAEGRVLVAAAIAKDAAPFVHPRLASQKLVVRFDLADMTDAALEEEIGDLTRREEMAGLDLAEGCTSSDFAQQNARATL